MASLCDNSGIGRFLWSRLIFGTSRDHRERSKPLLFSLIPYCLRKTSGETRRLKSEP